MLPPLLLWDAYIKMTPFKTTSTYANNNYCTSPPFFANHRMYWGSPLKDKYTMGNCWTRVIFLQNWDSLWSHHLMCDTENRLYFQLKLAFYFYTRI